MILDPMLPIRHIINWQNIYLSHNILVLIACFVILSYLVCILLCPVSLVLRFLFLMICIMFLTSNEYFYVGSL